MGRFVGRCGSSCSLCPVADPLANRGQLRQAGDGGPPEWPPQCGLDSRETFPWAPEPRSRRCCRWTSGGRSGRRNSHGVFVTVESDSGRAISANSDRILRAWSRVDPSERVGHFCFVQQCERSLAVGRDVQRNRMPTGRPPAGDGRIRFDR